jgi:hypothetical protein
MPTGGGIPADLGQGGIPLIVETALCVEAEANLLSLAGVEENDLNTAPRVRIVRVRIADRQHEAVLAPIVTEHEEGVAADGGETDSALAFVVHDLKLIGAHEWDCRECLGWRLLGNTGQRRDFATRLTR